MASKRISKSSINWLELSQRVPVEQKSNYIAFKGRSDAYLRKVLENPETPPKIDWSYYKANAANKTVIEQLEKAYNAFTVPYPSAKEAIAQIEVEEKDHMDDVRKFVQESQERVKTYEKQLELIASSVPVIEMCQQEFAIAYPDLALKPLEKPTFWPHTEDAQFTEEDLAYHRSMRQVRVEPDRYFP